MGQALDLATPTEVANVLDRLGIKTGSPDTAKINRDGVPDDFKVFIQVNLAKNGEQHLLVTVRDDAGNKKTWPLIKVSGGRGNFSDVLRGKCFTPDNATGYKVPSQAYGSNMIYPTFFRGRCREGEEKGGMVFGIHGLEGEKYVNLLGSEASHGCIRTTRKNAKKIQELVSKNMGGTLICIDEKPGGPFNDDNEPKCNGIPVQHVKKSLAKGKKSGKRSKDRKPSAKRPKATRAPEPEPAPAAAEE